MTPVRIYTDDTRYSDFFILMASNLSPDGVFLCTDLLFPEGERFDIEYLVPGRVTPVRGWGRVVRVETGEEDQIPGMAVRIERPDRRAG